MINFASQRNFQQALGCLFFNEHSNMEERDEYIRRVNKLH